MWDLVRATDWSATSLGPYESWSVSLKSTLRMVLASHQTICFWWGPDLIQFHNEAYLPILGKRVDWAFGKPFRKIWEDVWESVEPFVRSALNGQGTWTENLPLTMTRNGYPEPTYWSFSYSPLYDDDGKIAGILNITTETTQTVLASHALALANETLQEEADASQKAQERIWETSVDLLGVADEGGVWRTINPAWTRSLGWKPDEIIGQTSEWLEHPDDRAKTRAQIAKLASGATTFDFVNRLRRTDGSYCTLSWKAVPADGLFYCVARDMTEELARASENEALAEALGAVNEELISQREADKLRRVMQRELSHRMKNSLAMVQAIVSQTARTAQTVEDANKSIQARLQALAQAQDLLVYESDAGTDLRSVVEMALKAHQNEAQQIIISGPPTSITGQQGMCLSLALHELATNATKYGALAHADGTVTVTWNVDGNAFSFLWREQDGPVVVPPTANGFGSRLLTRLLPSYFGGAATLSYESTGVIYLLKGLLSETDA